MRTATFFLLVVSCRGFQTSSKFAHIIAQASTSRAETPSLQVLGAGRGEGNADRDFGQKTIPRGKGAINFIQACEAYQEELLDGQAAAAQSIVRASTVAVGAKAQKAKTAPSRARVLEMASAGRQESYAPSSAGSWGARSVDKVFKSGTSLPVCEDVRAARASDTLKHERNALLEEQRLQQQKLQLQQQLLQQEQQQQLQQQQQLLQQRQQLQQQQQQKQLQIQLQQVQQQKQQRKDVAPPPDQRRRGGAPAMGYMPVQYLKMTREDDKAHLEELMASVPYRMSAMSLYVKVQQNLTANLGRPPTSSEWASALNMHPSELRGSIEASSAVKARLVSRFSPLVRAVVLKYRGRGVPTRDLLQEGACGLIQAAERFDPSRGAQFSTYAVPWIRKHVSRCLQTHGRMIRLPQRAHEQSVKMGRARGVLTEELGRTPTLEEVASYCKIKVGVAALYDTANSDVLSLDGAAAMRIGGVLSGAAKRSTLGDRMLCPESQPEDAAALSELRGELHEVLSVLRPLERDVLSLRFGLAPAVNNARESAWMAGSKSPKWVGRVHSYAEVIEALSEEYPELVAKKDVVKVERRAFYQLQQPAAIAKIEQLRHAMYPQNPPESSFSVGGSEWS